MIQPATEVRYRDRLFEHPTERIKLSEQLGYDAVFTAEEQGSDPLAALGHLSGRTRHLKLGTRVLQIIGRHRRRRWPFRRSTVSPGATGFWCGIGSSIPAVAEGLHG